MKLFLFAIPLLITTPVLAQDVTVGCAKNTKGFDICYENHGQGGNDVILVDGPDGVDYVRVICDPQRYNQINNWGAEGPNTYEFIQMTVNEWCN